MNRGGPGRAEAPPDSRGTAEEKPVGVYVHVPFCGKKCPYCDFYSLPWRKDQAERYTQALLRNFQRFREKHGKIPADTFYAGGGTPSLLSVEQWSQILEAASECFDWRPGAEVSLEANPGTLTPDRLAGLKRAGFTRISIGIQSLIQEECAVLGRSHTPQRALQAVFDAAEAGFTEISADLMLGIPGQTQESLLESVGELCRLPVTHVSAYLLSLEEGTPFAERYQEGGVPDGDEAAELYLACAQALEEAGFPAYEISNFAKDHHVCRHNLHYWRCEEYAGFGPSSHSYFGGRRYEAPQDLEAFLTGGEQEQRITESSPGDFLEYAMLNLRLAEGLDLWETERRFPGSRERLLQRAKSLGKTGESALVSLDGERLSLTRRGFLLSNAVIGKLIL